MTHSSKTARFTRRRALASAWGLLSVHALAAAGCAAPRSPTSPRSSTPSTSAPQDATRAFLDAVRRGDAPRVGDALARDRGLARARDDEGLSAFVIAQLHDRGEVAAQLREAGLELDIVEAALAGDWERFDALAVADPDALTRAHPIGGTPLYAAALVGSVELWRLRSRGCRPDAAPRGGTGYTPARGAMDSPRASWAGIALADLCGNGGDINAAQRGGSSVLHGAVQRRDAALVRLAIRKGADVTARDVGGRTAEQLADSLGWREGQLLLAAHTSLPRDNRSSRAALDASGRPIAPVDLSDVPQALQSAVTSSCHRDLGTVRELIAGDARLVFSRSTDDELPIEACAHTGARPIIRFLLEHGAPLSLPTAVSLGDVAAIKAWLARDPSLIHERGAHDFPVMWYTALGGGSVAVAEQLAAHGASVDQESRGTTTLHWCARRGDRELAAWLLERGADVEAVGYSWRREGQTPLQVATELGDAAFARLLKDAGARR